MTEVVGFVLSSAFGLRNLAALMVAPVSYPMASLIVFSRLADSNGSTRVGRLCIV
jgi:hypothetical protein